MAKYKCGDRECTDEELDMIEKVRSGSAIVTDPAHASDADSIKQAIEEAVNNSSPKFSVSAEAITEAITDAMSKNPIQLVDTHSYEEHLKNCPDCQAKEDHRLESIMPELAAKYGYELKQMQPPDPQEKPEEKKEQPEEQQEEPEKAEEPAETATPPEEEKEQPEEEPEPESQEEREGFGGTLDRIFH